MSDDTNPLISFTSRIFRRKPPTETVSARDALPRRATEAPPVGVTPAAPAANPEFATRFLKDFAVQEFEVSRGVYTPQRTTVLKVRPTPYGFVHQEVDFVPIGMAIWVARTEMTERMERGNMSVFVAYQAAIDSARVLPDSEVVRKMLVRSRLVEINGKCYRSRHDRVVTQGFSTMAVDDNRPIIFAAPSAPAMAELKRRALAVNLGKRVVTVQFD
jgi:hypothetical protein